MILWLVLIAIGTLLLLYAQGLPRAKPPYGELPFPPRVPGLVLLGNTLQLSSKGASFVSSCRKQYGDIFSLSLAGRRMTIVCNAKAAGSLLTAPAEAVAFRPAVEQFTQRIFGLPSEAFFPKHLFLLSTLRGLLSPMAIPPHLHTLLQHLAHGAAVHWDAPQQGDCAQVDLVSSISALVFDAAVATLFGSKLLQRHGHERLRKAFSAFEGLFELAASPLPHIFIPQFRAARSLLLASFRQSIGDFEDTVAGQLLADCAWLPAKNHANLLLALLWASLANSVPACIWATAHLLLPQHARHAQAVHVQCSQLGAAGEWEAGVVQAALQKGGALSRVVAETVRLYSPGMDVRMAQQRLQLPNGSGMTAILPGTLLAISPYELHTSTAVYGSSAADFDPARSLHSAEGGAVWPWGHAGVAFGGGHFRCPGRAFAEAEIAVVLGFLLTQYDMRLQTDRHLPASGEHVASLPEPELRRQIGVRWPTSECWASVRRRLTASNCNVD